MIVLACALSGAPASFQNAWGFAPEGAAYSLLSPWLAQPGALSAGSFIATCRAALVATWAAWALLLAAGARAAEPPSSRLSLSLVVGVAGLAVVAFPPMLSRDVLGYVAYGRLPGLHGLNPYLHGGQSLAVAGDPTAAFLVWDTPLPYGPLWVLLSAALAQLARVGGVLLEVTAHKAVAGASLLAAAVIGGRLAGLQRPSARWWVVLAIGFNPLLLVEGPGTGHNDLLMVALLVWGAWLSAQRRHAAAALAIGLAVAVKPVAIAAVPLLLAERWWRSGSSGWKVLYGLVLSVAPTLLLSLPFGGPSILIDAVTARATAGPTRNLAMLAGVLAVAGVLAAWRIRQEIAAGTPAPWLSGSVPLTLAIALAAMAVHFPWYLTWALLPAHTGLEGRNVAWLAATSIIAFRLMWLYTTPL